MQSFRKFIRGLEDILVDAVRQAELQEWHHLPTESEQFQHYLRLCTWAEEVAGRRARYDAIKAAGRESRATKTAWFESQADRLGGHAPTVHPSIGSPDDTDAAWRALGQGGHREDDSC